MEPNERGETFPRLGEYFDRLHVSEQRIGAAITKAKLQMEQAILGLEAVCQAELDGMTCNTEYGSMAKYIEQSRADIEDMAGSVLWRLSARADQLESGS